MPKYLVTASALTVRDGPDKTFKAIGYLKQADIVEVLDSNQDNSWARIQTPSGLIGWCSSQYLSPVSSNPPSQDILPSMGTYTVNSVALFMRQGPTRNYRVTGFLRRGETVGSLEGSLDGVWIKIHTKRGNIGWSLSKHLIRDQSSAPSETGMHRLTKYSVDIYQNPGQDFVVVGQALADYLVNVTEISPDKLWKKISTNMGLTGWCLAEFLVSLGEMGSQIRNEEFPWMPIAFGEIGVREYPGSKHNPRVQEYLNSTVLGDGPTLPDETHWCAAFVNWCVEKAGIASNNSPMVSSWTRWGRALKVPRRGCIVTFKWDDGGSHVAFYVGESSGRVYACGGNQSDGVWLMSYPKKNVTSYRIPVNWGLVNR